MFLACVAALVILSVFGAFLGSGRAKALFNSPPACVLWVLLAALFAAGLLSFKRLTRSPGLLALHAGALVVLLGSMWGSERGHAIARRLFGVDKLTSGYLMIFEGESTNAVVDARSREVEAHLPFALRLDDFRIDYYDDLGRRWDLAVARPGGTAERIDWQVGQPLAVHPDVSVRVLEYLSGARARYADGHGPALLIETLDGAKARLDAETGKETTLAGGAKVRIAQAYANLKVLGFGADRRVVDLGGRADNPALKLDIENPDGSRSVRHVLARRGPHAHWRDGLKLRYVLPEPAGATPDHASTRPAAHIELVADTGAERFWLVPEADAHVAAKALDAVLDHPALKDTWLVLQTAPAVKEYTSDVTVLEEGRPVVQKAIEVNHPLHYGGYHFYQHSYDTEAGQYTVLHVVSDSGWNAVRIGFFVMLAGAFAHFWIRPAVAGARSGKRDGR